MRALALIAVTLVTLAPRAVSADTVGLLINESQFGTSDTEAVMLAITVAVEAVGDTPVWFTSPDDVASASQSLRSASCPLDCFQHYLAALGVQRVFSTSVWRVEEGASIGMTYRAHDRQFSISVPVADFRPSTLEPAIDQAHRQLRRWDGGHAPVLRIVTQPAGATVVLDGRPAGMTPLELPARPGSVVRVAISLRDHETVRSDVTIPTEGEANLELTLTRVPTAAERAAQPRSLAVPVAMAALGGAGVAGVLAVAALPSRCDRRDADGRCVGRQQRNGAALGVYGAVAGVLLVGGVIWTVRVRNHNERTTALSVGPGFVQVGGSF